MTTPNQNNPPQYSSTARGLLDTFAAAKYPSQLRNPGPESSIIRAELSKSITTNERDVALRALQHCRDLMKPNPLSPSQGPEGVSPVSPNASEQPWSPSDVLGSMDTEPRELSGIEKSQPNGDK